MPRTMVELAQEALDIQTACNLPALVLGWHEALNDLMAILNADGPPWSTDQINKHPINVLWVSKFASLTNGHEFLAYAKASDWAKGLIAAVEIIKEAP